MTLSVAVEFNRRLCLSQRIMNRSSFPELKWRRENGDFLMTNPSTPVAAVDVLRDP